MKKITFLLAVACATITSYAQTITLETINGDPVATFLADNENSLHQGQVLSYSISYANASATSIKSQINAPVGNNQGGINTPIMAGAGPFTVNFDFTIASTIVVAGDDVATGTSIVNFFAGSGSPSANFGMINVYKDEATKLLALSKSNFSKEDLEGAYYNGTDSIVINSSGAYAIYNLSGVAVSEGTISGDISVEGLTSGVYILATEAGVLKFVK